MKYILLLLLLPSFVFSQTTKTITVPPSKTSTVVKVVASQVVTITPGEPLLPIHDTLVVTKTNTVTVTLHDTIFKCPPVTPPVTTTPTGKSLILSLPTKSLATSYDGKSNLVIENIEFSNAAAAQNGNILKLTGCTNVTIRNCRFTKGTGGDNGGGRGIYLYGCTNVTITNCLFDNMRGGILASACNGNVKVNYNQFVNMVGPFPNGQFVQINQCNGTGYEVVGNAGENFAGESNPEDMVNLYGSSNVLVDGNTFRANGASSASGGGIVSGDAGGGNNTISNNKLVQPGQYGVAIVGAANSKIINNQIYADYKVGNNVGIPIYAANPPCTNVTVMGNRVHYVNTPTGGRNDFWYSTGGDACTFITKQATTDITLAEMNVPAHLISMVTPDELLKIRAKQL